MFAAGADRICSVVAPLSTMRVSGSQTVERMPTGASSRPAWSSRLVSRGAARRGAAEERVDRLLLRLAGGQALRSGDRRREAEVGRDDQRRIARDLEFVGRRALARQRGAAARRDRGDEP